MKGVLDSLRGFFPARSSEESGSADPVKADENLAQPGFEQVPQRPTRQMVDMADIAAAEADGPTDPMERPSSSTPDPALQAMVMEAVKTVRDPEIPVNLVDLGLIYEFDVNTEGEVLIEMTLTTPNCPSAADLPQQVEEAARSVDGVKDVRVKLVFTPPWHQGLMSEEARLELGLV